MKHELIVVGAGIAGLRVGIEFLRAHPSASCLLLERNSYVGGRVYTFRQRIPGVGPVQWEAGAGRIASSHHKVLGLLAQYGLTTLPISSSMSYCTPGHSPEPNRFTDLISAYLAPLQQLPSSLLQQHTLGELCEQLQGKDAAQAFLSHFPYDSEIHTLRADQALQSFSYEMGTNKGYVVCKEGLDTLMERMAKDFKARGGRIRIQCEVTNVRSTETGACLRTRHRGTVHQEEADRVVLAVSVEGLRPLLPHHPIMKQLVMRPLFRMYAVFPVSHGTCWFSDLSHTVTPTPLRDVIPIDASKGICMISYTDGTDAEYWMRQKESAIPRLVMKRVRALFADRIIPEPLFFKLHPWKEGCTYWRPGPYEVAEASRAIMNPMPHVHVCGESYATTQCWLECAIEHADAMMQEWT